MHLKGRRLGRHDVLFGGSAAVIAVAVFTIDTFTEIEGAVAVLYAIALLLAAQSASRAGILKFSAIFLVLTTTSFVLTHTEQADFPTYMRFFVALMSLGLTTALLLRNDRARSELLQSNAALELSEARYRSIFDRTRVALWERDYSRLREYLFELRSSGITDIRAYARIYPEIVNQSIAMITIVAANEAALELLGESSVQGSDATKHNFIPLGSETFVEIMQAIIDGRSYFEDNAEILTDRGETKAVLLTISFPDDVSDFDRVIVGMVDITQREQARRALAEAQEELSRASRAATIGALSASLAHELNQPLGAIAVNAQTLTRWLDRDPPDIAAAKRSAERILRDSTRASDILKSTRLMLSQKPRARETVDLAKLVDDTLVLMRHDLQSEKVEVEVIETATIPCIHVVRLELQQVLINLISNAMQAITAANATTRMVTVTLSATEDAVVIGVRDSGRGLDDALIGKLFTPFFTTKTSGMGIGLSICRGTIESMGGNIEARNHPEGGALFEIQLPKETEDG